MSAFSVAVPRVPARVAFRAPARPPVRPARAVATRATAVDVASKLSTDDVAQWESVKTLVVGLGMDDEQAEKCMIRAFGWGAQSYWRESKVNEVPCFDDVEARLDFLAEIGIPGDKMAEMLGKVPEILGCPLSLLRDNVEYVEKNYFMKRATKNFANYVLRTPQALGNNVDCAGTCVGECNRCWVR
jgi:hypothetical protein